MEDSRSPVDVFDGKSFIQVRADHFPDGIQYRKIAPEDMPELTIEHGLFVPNANPESYRRDRVFVQLPGYPNHLEDEGSVTKDVQDTSAPNRHALRAAALSAATGRPVHAFGFPGGQEAGELPKELRMQIERGEFKDLSKYYAQLLKDQGVTQVDVDGYSLGGAITPDFCMACIEQGIEVNSIFWGAVANAVTDGGGTGLFMRFKGIGNQADYDRYASESVALSQEAQRHVQLVKGIGATALQFLHLDGILPIAKKFSSVATPTARAFALGMAHGKWLPGPLQDATSDPAYRMHLFLQKSPKTKLHLYVGANDPLVPVAAMQRIADRLRVPLHVLENRNHSVRDDLPFMNGYIVSNLE